MSFAGRLDELPRPIWVALAILGFVLWWPLGIAILAHTLWSGKMACCGIKMGCCGIEFGRWYDDTDRQPLDWWHQPRTSGNQTFDEYRVATLRRLEEEQREFQEFLARLRTAKDKAEFDQFMADRSTRSEPSRPQA